MLPHFNYSLLVWGNIHTFLLDNLFNLQKRVIRNISHVSYRSHTAPLFIQLKTLTLYDLYKYQLGIFLYKFHHSLLPSAFDDFYSYNTSYHTYETRSKEFLHHPYSRTSLNASQIRSTGVYFWNSLSPGIKSSPSLTVFKRRLKEFLLSSKLN